MRCMKTLLCYIIAQNAFFCVVVLARCFELVTLQPISSKGENPCLNQGVLTYVKTPCFNEAFAFVFIVCIEIVE